MDGSEKRLMTAVKAAGYRESINSGFSKCVMRRAGRNNFDPLKDGRAASASEAPKEEEMCDDATSKLTIDFISLRAGRPRRP